MYTFPDMLGDICVRVYNGSLDNKKGGERSIAFKNEEAALEWQTKQIILKNKDRGEKGRYWLVYE